jgi:Tfp pilus assembly protein PilE
MMIVVAVIAILAVIAIPAFFSQGRKGKASSETSAMFAELSTKEEQYKVDNGVYFGTAASTAQNTSTCPAAPSSTLQLVAPCIVAGQPWATLHINPPEQKVYCSYAITVGPSTTAPVPPAPFFMSSDGTNPAAISAWYYIIATCDMDGVAARNSAYFMSSMDTRIQSTNEGY